MNELFATRFIVSLVIVVAIFIDMLSLSNIQKLKFHMCTQLGVYGKRLHVGVYSNSTVSFGYRLKIAKILHIVQFTQRA